MVCDLLMNLDGAFNIDEWVACVGLALAYITAVTEDPKERGGIIANIRAVTILSTIPASSMFISIMIHPIVIDVNLII